LPAQGLLAEQLSATAVNNEIVTVNESTIIAGEVKCSGGNVMCETRPWQWCCFRQIAGQFVELRGVIFSR
jgi:hypothetical protein